MASRTSPRLRSALVGALSALALLAVAPAASAAPGDRHERRAPASVDGALTQLAGPRGCVADRSGRLAGRRCGSARALRGPAPFMGSDAVAISPDGRHVYVASSTSDAIAVLARDARTGVLTQPDGTAGCVAAGGAEGCAPATGLDGPNSVAVSPDGATVYATSRGSASVTAFARDARSGALTQLADGCIAATPSDGCRAGRALTGANAVTVSPDGTSVYVAAFLGNAVAVLTRDPATGALAQPDGAAGCVAAGAMQGCAPAIALAAPEGVVVSPDGTTVHVVSALGNAVLTFTRDAATGALTPLAGETGCIVAAPLAGCATGRAVSGPNALALSPDGSNVYVASVLSASLTAFARTAPTGGLAQLDGLAGCVTARPTTGCGLGRGFRGPEGVAVSPDGRNVYVASFVSGAIGVLVRDPATGAARQAGRRAGCVALSPEAGCRRGRALAGVSSVAVSPDGRHVYAAAFASNAVTVFRRAAR